MMAPNMDAASQQVSAQLDPLLKNIADEYNTDAQNASDQIGALYNHYADVLGGQVGIQRGIYNPAIRTEQNTAEGVKGNILQAGEHAAAGLAASLSQAGLPANAGGTDINLSAMGGGSSDAAYALGQAGIKALKSAEDAAIGYASKLPGFAKLEGDYQTQTVLAQLAAAMSKQMAETTAQAPGLYYQIYNDLEDRRRQAAQDAERVREFNAQLGASQGAASARADNYSRQQANTIAAARNKASDHYYEARQTKNGWSVVDLGPKTSAGTKTKPMQHVTIGGKAYAFDPNTGTFTDPSTGQAVAPQAPPGYGKQPYRFQGTDGLTYAVKNGRAVPIPGQSGPKPVTGTKPKGQPTDAQLNAMIQKWHQGGGSVSSSTNETTGTVTKTTTQTSQAISYQQALRRLRSMGVPEDKATQMLNTEWRRGESGRPWLGVKTRNTLSKAGLRPAVRYEIVAGPKKGTTRAIPYLVKAQVDVLQAAGQLPEGQWAQGPTGQRVYVVAAGY